MTSKQFSWWHVSYSWLVWLHRLLSMCSFYTARCRLALTVPSSASALEALETQHLRSYIRHQTYTTQQMPWQPGNDKFLEQPVCQMLMAGKRSIQDTQSLLQPFAQAQMGGGMLRRVVLHEDHFGPRLLSSGTGWCSKCWGIIYIYIGLSKDLFFYFFIYLLGTPIA